MWEEEIARRRDGTVLAPAQLLEAMQLGGPGAGVEPAPRVGADPGDDGQPAVGHAETDRALQRGEVGEQVARGALGALAERHEKNAASVSGVSTGWGVGGPKSETGPASLIRPR